MEMNCSDMLKALDMAAGMSGCGMPLPMGEARVIALEVRAAEGKGRRSTRWSTPSR
jgi:hypothetical protein